MIQPTKKIRRVLKKGDYHIILERVQKKDPNISYDNVLAYFNNRVVAEQKGKYIFSAGKALYKKRTGKKLEEA